MENTPEGPRPSLPEKSPIERLKDGVLLRYSLKELEHPNYHALSAIPDEIQPLQHQWRYASEILRVLAELKMTLWFLDNKIPNEEELRGLSQHPEDVIIYYQGVFLELTHQLRDKILRLVAMLLDGKEPNARESEKLIKRLIEEAQKQGITISDDLNKWSDDPAAPRTGIITAIVLRTNHHHGFSRLGAHPGFLDTKMSRAFKQEQAQKVLSLYGQEQIAAMGIEGLKKLTETAQRNARNTMQEIETALNALACKLLSAFDLDPTVEKYILLAEKQKAFAEQVKIENTCRQENIPTVFQPLLDDIKESVSASRGGIIAVYMIGSTPRGDYDHRFSDINLVVIAENDELKETATQAFPPENDTVSTQLFTEKEFADKENLLATKFRFLCKYDGILIAGKEFTDYEIFPKPSAELGWMLHHDFVDRIEYIEKWTVANPDADQITIGRMSKKVIKLAIDTGYVIAMTNDPRYIHNRLKRIDFVNTAFPEYQDSMALYKKILLSGGLGDIGSLTTLTASIKENGIHALAQLKPIYDRLKPKK